MSLSPHLLLAFYVPEANAEDVKQALFDLGLGSHGEYDQCCWQTLGQGQFRPREGSTPYLGKQGHLERVPELKVEMICPESLVAVARQTLKSCHPYEEPAFHFTPILDL